jgi:hypothetical protein
LAYATTQARRLRYLPLPCHMAKSGYNGKREYER